MKIRVKKKSWREVSALPPPKHKNPKVSSPLLRFLMKALGRSDLKQTGFGYRFEGIEKIPDEPCLILMNHSAFIDLEIVSSLLYPSPFAIVCTSDGFVGKEGLMRRLGCIPTDKFVPDARLIRDVSFALKKNRTHVLMYPEASYSFDGRATPLPEKLGSAIKLWGVPVIMIKTEGAFLRDPLYNMLQKRKVKVSAKIYSLVSKDELSSVAPEEIDSRLAAAFDFDNFADQRRLGIKIDEPFRADGIERILYRCPHCGSEGRIRGSGISFGCSACGASYELDEYGRLIRKDGDAAFGSVPEWYAWEREEVRRELESGDYSLSCPVKILVLRDYRAVYDIGSGRLSHTGEGFRLVSDDGALDYSQSSLFSYSLYSDFFWYEIGDMICIGRGGFLYYCFPDEGIPVAKARLAAEEAYTLRRAETRSMKK